MLSVPGKGLGGKRFTLTTVYLVKYSSYHLRFIFVCVCLASVCSSLFLAQRKTLIFICCMNKCMNAFSQLFRTFCCRCTPLQDQKYALCVWPTPNLSMETFGSFPFHAQLFKRFCSVYKKVKSILSYCLLSKNFISRNLFHHKDFTFILP